MEVKPTGLFAGLTNSNQNNNTGGIGLFSNSVKSSGLFSDIKSGSNGNNNNAETGNVEGDAEKEVPISNKYQNTGVKLDKIVKQESSTTEETKVILEI